MDLIDVNKLKSDLSDIRNDFDNISDTVDDDIVPQFQKILNQLYDISNKGKETLNEFENKIPEIQSDIDAGIDIINSTLEKLEKLEKYIKEVRKFYTEYNYDKLFIE